MVGGSSGVGYDLLVVLLKEQTRRERHKIQPSLSLPLSFLPCLVMGADKEPTVSKTGCVCVFRFNPSTQEAEAYRLHSEAMENKT